MNNDGPDGRFKKADEEFERWSKEVKRGAVSLAILALLNGKRDYGYEVVKRLAGRGAFLQLDEGTVYPLLRRLEKRGLLESEWNYDDPAKPRKYYSVTDEGRYALTRMVKSWNMLSEEMRGIISGVELQ